MGLLIVGVRFPWNRELFGFRATKIRRFDKALVTIPNARLAGEALINFSRMTNRRIYWKIGLEYRTTKEQLRLIIQDILAFVKSDPDFEIDPKKTKTFVFMDSFGASSIDVMLYCFTKTTEWGEWLRVKERLAYRVKMNLPWIPFLCKEGQRGGRLFTALNRCYHHGCPRVQGLYLT